MFMRTPVFYKPNFNQVQQQHQQPQQQQQQQVHNLKSKPQRKN